MHGIPVVREAPDSRVCVDLDALVEAARTNPAAFAELYHHYTVTIKAATIRDLDVSGISLFDLAELARQLSAASAGKESRVHLLPQKTLNGRTVDVLQTDWSGPPSDRGRYTLYVNARTYLFVGLDLQGTEHGHAQFGTFRVTTDQTMPNSAVPQGTFAFTPPKGARIVPAP